MSQKEIWYETLHANFGQYFSIDHVLYHEKTDHQDLIIFENAALGRMMALDGVVQTTERDEFIYHEMLTHVPLLAHGNAKRILIIGGGDGAMLREICRHRNVEQITMVEIDASVVAFCRQYLPQHNAGAYNDPRFRLIIDDGVNFVKQCHEKFDVIISDCTDPIGPGESLFTSDFYQGCARCLNEGGIFVAQNGVCFLQQEEAVNSHKKLSHYFSDVSFYQAAVPTYYGGIMTFAWACNDPDLRQISLDKLQHRFASAEIECRYYNPAIHIGSFALPQYLLNALSASR
ncbi:polyamine aminopropyltransferase [Pectobacteriaceae bacterium CE70]|uniref:Polyamine aminopropyltransferase n=1 Tax=Serratia sp. (strain ATCC 39006) TaxID=104623 RepID=A0A2I5THX7_SERS3|nr:polyamine aminopropyltransferase [Serratia sp. ATCC 39006]WJV61623.1 polyamine aminopropyltransferase [Pectobacteriaceae bacterium C52]WJV65899.1 polyamine aminopropyltransferase [Pectobacteriaceae bacterium CE70]WJY09916.1 polyamine aminopropyltransferase [Pectobacteriaceae bacterium C80]AUG99854.1 polyamine aminopropyltransferase [Serratia sp. ATCC 39006]AUH04174.1 polyamine aminopropyltransferase [Serratia sp. ATCC 39006]